MKGGVFIKAKLAAALVAAVLALSICVRWCFHSAGSSDTWRVALMALPVKISPKEMSISGYYIIKQTHEPVFRREDGYNYKSKILKRWSRSMDYKEYVLCPDTQQYFDARHPFSFDFFLRHMREITPNFSAVAEVKAEGDCVRVSFPRPARKYLDFLTTYANAPSVQISSVTEIGLGPFLLERIDASEVALSRKKREARGFNEIRVYGFSGVKSEDKRAEFISDYNFALGRKDLAALGPQYRHFENMSLKSAMLLINLPDKESRGTVYNCLDIDGLRTVFTGGPGNFRDIATILPVGVPGGLPGKPVQNCRITKSAAKKLNPVVFANWQAGKTAEFESFFKEFTKKTGIRVVVKDFKPAQLSAAMRTGPRPYGLVIMITAPDSDDKFRFLTSYFGKKNVRDSEIRGLSSIYEELIKEDDPDKEKRLARDIASKIAEDYALLPLYQTVSTVYYPRDIKNIVVGKELLEYPEVAEFRW